MTADNSAAYVTGSDAVTLRFDGGGVTQVYPPLAVGCACRQEEQDPLGCMPEYNLPGVGPVVPLEAYLAVVEALRSATDG